jgi:hypothetical protein
MEKVIEQLESNLNHLVQEGPSEHLHKSFEEICQVLLEYFELKPKYNSSKIECPYCKRFVSKAGYSSHKKSKRHIIEEAKHYNQWDFALNDFKH